MFPAFATASCIWSVYWGISPASCATETIKARVRRNRTKYAASSMRIDAAHVGIRRPSSQRRIGCSVTVMTSARKTGPMMSAMDLMPARVIVKAAAPSRSVRANG